MTQDASLYEGQAPLLSVEPSNAGRQAAQLTPRFDQVDSRRRVGPLRGTLNSTQEVTVLRIPWGAACTAVFDPGKVPFGSRVTVTMYAVAGGTRVAIAQSTSQAGEPVVLQGTAGCDSYEVTAALETLVPNNATESFAYGCSYDGDVTLGDGRKPATFWSEPASANYESSRILKGAPGKLFMLVGHSGAGATKFVQVFDALAVPNQGVEPTIATFPVDAGKPFSLEFPRAKSALTGLVFVGSSSGTSYQPDPAALFFLSAEMS